MVEPSNIIHPEDPTEEDEWLKSMYRDSDLPVDQLAYTREFEELFQRFSERFQRPDTLDSRREMLNRLLSLRKAGKLPRFRGEGEHGSTRF